jgi:hypothetical protein
MHVDMSDGKAVVNYRTKSWEDAIVEHVKLGENVQLVEYQPGNGTRYGVTFVYVPKGYAGDDPRPRRYIPAPCWIVAIPDHNCTMEVHADGGFLHWTYVAEKLNKKRKYQLSAADIVPVTELIGRITGREVISSAEQENEDRARWEEEQREKQEVLDAMLPPIDKIQGE